MPWYNNELKYRIRLNITNAYNSANLNNFITLISLNNLPNINHFFKNTKRDLSDVVFTLSDGITKIPHEFDRNTTGIFVWLKLPVLYSSSQTIIYMYYGNENASYSSNPQLVFSDFRCVYHLNNEYSVTLKDYSGLENNGTITGSLSILPPPIVGDSLNFPGTSYITIPHNDSLNITDNLVVEFWLYLNTNVGIFDILSKGNAFRIYISSGILYFSTGSNTLASTILLSAATLYKITCLKTPTNKFIYINSANVGFNTYTTTIATNTSPLLISSFTYPLNGRLDELRYGVIGDSVNIAQRESASYNNVANINSFITFSNLETKHQEDPCKVSILNSNANYSILNSISYKPGKNKTTIKGEANIVFRKKFIWLYRMAIEINTTSITFGPNLTDFPLLVDIKNSGGLREHIAGSSSGDDFVFTLSDEETVIPHEIENYDPSTGRLRVWVKIPQLIINSTQTIWMYYGHNSVGSTQKVSEVWSNYLAVYHLNTHPTGEPPQAKDSAGGRFDMASSGFSYNDFVAGIVYNGYYFDDINNKLTSQKAFNFGEWNSISAEVWDNVPALNNEEMALGQKATDNAASDGCFYVGVRNNNLRVQIRTNTNAYRFDVNGVVQVGWNYLAFNWLASNPARIFNRGVLVSTRAVNGSNLLTSRIPMTIGNTYSSNNRLAIGAIDEARVSNIVFPDNYYLAVYNNIVNQSSFVDQLQPEAHWENTVGKIEITHFTNPNLEIDIIFGYPFIVGSNIGPSGGLYLTHETNVFSEIDIEFVRTTSGKIVLKHENNQFYFSQTFSPSGSISIFGEAYTFSEKNYYPYGGKLDVFCSQDITAKIEIERVASGGVLFSGLNFIDYIELIYLVQVHKSLSASGGDYFITFEREMIGGVLCNGVVGEFDAVDINIVDVSGNISITPISLNNYAILYIPTNICKVTITRKVTQRILNYIFKADGLVRFNGATTALIKANALYLYSSVLKIIINREKAAAKYFVLFEKIAYGGLYLRRFRSNYSYIPIYSYRATGVCLTLSGGISYVSFKWVVSIGKINVRNSSDVLSDSFAFNYSYKAFGGFSLRGSSNYTSLKVYNTYTTFILIKIKSLYILHKKNYLYDSHGVITVLPAKNHKYKSSGSIVIDGLSDLLVNKIFVYNASGLVVLNGRFLKNNVDLNFQTLISNIVLKRITNNFKQLFYYNSSGKILLVDANYKYVYKSLYRLKINITSSNDVDNLLLLLESFGDVIIKPSSHYYLLEENVFKAHGKVYAFGRCDYKINTIFDYTTRTEKIHLTSLTRITTSKNFILDICHGGILIPQTIAIVNNNLVFNVISSKIEISGKADLSYKYTASGYILLSGELYSIINYFSGTQFGKISIIRTKADSKMSTKNIGSGGIKTLGRGAYSSIYNYSLYIPDSSNFIRLTIKSFSLLLNNYKYIAQQIAILLNIFSNYNFSIVKHYTAYGKTTILNGALYQFSKSYIYNASGFLMLRGASTTVGYREFSYLANGETLLLGVSKTKKRYNIVILSNGAIYELYFSGRGVKQSLASKIFRFYIK